MKKGKLVLSVGLLVIFIVLIASVFTQNVSPYISVSDLKNGNVENKNVQLYGKVLVDSIHFDENSGIISFKLTDGKQNVSITHKGIISNLENSTEIVAVGEYRNGVFQAQNVLVKCPSKYEALASKEG